MMVSHQRVGPGREAGRVLVEVSLVSGESQVGPKGLFLRCVSLPGGGCPQCSAPTCSPGTYWQSLDMATCTTWGRGGPIFLLCQRPQYHQPGVGIKKEALSLDSGLTCPVGLLAIFPRTCALILGPAGSQRTSGFIRPPCPGWPGLCPVPLFLHQQQGVSTVWGSRPAMIYGTWARAGCCLAGEPVPTLFS